MDSNAQQKDCETPLHFACFRGKPEIACLLLDHGAQVDAKNEQRETPMHLLSRGEYDSPGDGVTCRWHVLLDVSWVGSVANSAEMSVLRSDPKPLLA
jgi:ankyrin repeat protein